MIVIERTVDISKPVQTETLRGNEFKLEANAHTFRISVVNNGAAVALTGSVSASMLLADGSGLTLGGSLDNGVAVLTLPQAAYGVPGRFMLAIYSVQTGATEAETVKTCIYACVGAVINTYGDQQYDPGNLIPDAETLAAYIEACQTATTAANDAAGRAETAALTAVTYAAQTGKTDADKMQARTNIGAAAKDDSYLAPMDAGVMKYLVTDLHGTKTFISGNHYVYNYDGAATTNTYVTNLIGATVGTTKTTLTNWQPSLEQMMPVDVFGKAIRFEYFCNSRGQSITRNPRIAYKFATVENGSITEYLGFGYMFDGVLDTPAEASITVPAGATHVALGIYYSGYNPSTVYDVVYSFRSAEGMSLPDAIAPVEEGLASRNYAVGELLMRRGHLYKVTQAIVTGGTISTSTNITETTIVAQLAALEARIAALEG